MRTPQPSGPVAGRQEAVPSANDGSIRFFLETGPETESKAKLGSATGVAWRDLRSATVAVVEVFGTTAWRIDRGRVGVAFERECDGRRASTWPAESM